VRQRGRVSIRVILVLWRVASINDSTIDNFCRAGGSKRVILHFRFSRLLLLLLAIFPFDHIDSFW
jgi:hypothetical protein